MTRPFSIFVVIMCAVMLGVTSCKNPVKDVFAKNWVSMDETDRKNLETYFNDQGYDETDVYWELCAEEGADTAGRINPWAAAPAVSKKVKVSVYVDNSSSMKGYYNSSKSAAVIEVLSGIQQYFSSEDDDIQGYYVDKGHDYVGYALDSLVADLTMKKLRNYDDSYQLDKIIGRMIDDYKSNVNESVISFLITDGIPSGTNEEINSTRPERNFSIISAAALQQRIASKFVGVQGMAVSVYQFISGFDGKYWYYDNSNEPKHIENRPFYVVVLGDRRKVSELAKKEAEGLNLFKAKEKVHFGGVDASKIFMNHTEITSDDFDDDGEADMNIDIIVEGLPYFARDEKFLKKNATLKINGKNVDNWNVQNGRMISFKLEVEQDERYKIEIRILNSTPSWVEERTCYDDKDKKMSDLEFNSKTFNFKYLVEGLKEGVTGMKGAVVLYENTFEINTNSED